MPIPSINPYNGEILTEFREHTAADINEILELSHKASVDWKEASFLSRGRLMKNCAGLLRSRSADLGKVITLEMGKRIAESEAEVNKCAWVCDYYADHAEKFLREEKLEAGEAESYLAYEPLGTVLAVMPWNFPFWQVFRFAAPALMAGNAGLLKHASNVPQCAIAIENIFLEAGFPRGLFQSVLLSAGRVGPVIDDPRVKAITLTGSEEAGRKVAGRAGQNIKKVVLELGGSDPFIVLNDAAVEEAAETAARARMINCGQSCIAAKRFILHEKISETFIGLFTRHLGLLEPGDPLVPSTGYGPLARPDLADQLEQQVGESIHQGAHLALGGKRPEGFSRAFYMPTLLTRVKPGMPAFDEEIFGPVAAVTVVETEEEAIALANHSRFGLGASLWTSDMSRAKALASKIESGAVFINEMVASHPAVPFGGIKSSGYGRELSWPGIREFMNLKSVWIKK